MTNPEILRAGSERQFSLQREIKDLPDNSVLDLIGVKVQYHKTTKHEDVAKRKPMWSGWTEF